MRAILKPTLWACIWLLVLPAADLWSAPPARPRDELSVLHVLIVADTANADIGASVGLDETHVAAVLTDGVKDAKRLQLTKLDGADATPDKILAFYKNLKGSIKADSDAVAFFYAGHGATIDGDHTLTLDAGKLKRKDLLDAMKATNAPLIICLTDCCATQIKGGRVVAASGAPEDNPVIRNLFFQARGVVDLTASTLDGSLGDDADGGYFTRSLTRCLRDKPENLAAPGDEGFVTWPAFFAKVRKATSDLCDDYVAKEHARGATPVMKHQTPRAWSIGDDGGGRFGVRVFDNKGDGVRVGQVLDPSPAKTATIEVGDVLLQIDDVALHGTEDFISVVDGSSGRIKVVVRDVHNTRRVVTLPEIKLDPLMK